MREEKLKTGIFEISSNASHIINARSNIYYMISEIIDNSLGSLGVNISDKHSKIANNIEILFHQKQTDRLDLYITDDCGGMEGTEENIQRIMMYGSRNETYKAPFFNVFGVGMKDSAMWSAKEFCLTSAKEGSPGMFICAKWENKSSGSVQQTYNYEDNSRKEIFWKTRNHVNIKSGTQIFFGDLYTEDNMKYTRTNIGILTDFLGWRYGKYIDSGLKIKLLFLDLDGKYKSKLFGFTNDTDTDLQNREPSFESFSKFFDFLQSKNKSIKRDKVNAFLINEFKDAGLSETDYSGIVKMIDNSDEIKFNGIFPYKYNEYDLVFPYEIGIAEYTKYKNAYEYERIYGLSIYQASRALEHGPRLKDVNSLKINPRDLDNQSSTGGGKAKDRRWIGSLNIDNYIEHFFDKNVMTKNKEFLKIPDEIYNSFKQMIKRNYIDKYSLFLHKLNEMQRDKQLHNKIHCTDNANLDLVANNGALISETVNDINDNVTIRPIFSENNVEPCHYKVKLDKLGYSVNINFQSLPNEKFCELLENENTKTFQFYVNKNEFEKLNLSNFYMWEDLILYLGICDFLNKFGESDNGLIIALKNLIGDEND